MNPTDFYQYILSVWLVCIMGLLLACPLSMRMPMRDFRPILHRRGIYDPKYNMLLFVAMLTGDFTLKFIICVRFLQGDLNNEMIMTAELFASFFLFILLWLLARILMPQVGNRNIRKVSGSTNYHRLAINITIVCTVYILSSYFTQRFYSGYWYGNKTDSLLATVAVFSIGALFIKAVYLQINRYDRIKDEAERTLEAIKTKHAPIIFLRSFELDKNVMKGYTFDEFICKCFSQHGQPIISLSDPDDFLPTGGSIKLQSLDDNWKEAIVLLLKNCRAVVIFEGRSEGLSWEISKIREYISPNKLFVATPPKSYREAAWFRGQGRNQLRYSLNYVWGHFTDKLRSVGIDIAQKDEPGADCIFTFDNRWHSNTSIRVKGIKFFDTILEKTIIYESLTCDYISLSKQLRKCELTRSLTKDESRNIHTGIRRVLVSYYFVVILVGILVLVL